MEQIILFAFLTLFPFGQIIKIGFINPIDVVVGIGAIYAIIKKLPRPKYFKYVNNFLIIIFFTWVVGAFYFWDIKVFYGFLYLIRLASYFYFSIIVFNFRISNLLLKSLVLTAVASAVFGWVQYFLYPNLTTFTIWGWDDHLYRMVGTFLDPGFLGIVLVLGAILTLFKLQNLTPARSALSIAYAGGFSFLAFSILFTYSRASYLALLISSLFVFKKFRYYLLFVICLLAIGIYLPRGGGEGVKLERTVSINQRLENYSQTLQIFKENPIFGVGLNNICLAKNSDFTSHSCSGADSSLLFLLATTGVAGLVAFVNMVFGIWNAVKGRSTFYILHSTFMVVMIHSFFSNSLFYSWVMGWLMILLGLSGKSWSKKDN